MPKLFDETPYELTEDGRRSMYDVLPKGSVISGDEVKEYGFEKIAKKVQSAEPKKTDSK